MTDDERAAVARNTPATDCLEDHGLHEDAETLREAPGKADLLERAVLALEAHVRSWLNTPSDQRHGLWGHPIAVIAEHRKETPEATLARLGPPPRDSGDDLYHATLNEGGPPGATGDQWRPWPMPGVAHRPDWHDMTSLPARSRLPLGRAVPWAEYAPGIVISRQPDGTYRPYRQGDPIEGRALYDGGPPPQVLELSTSPPADVTQGNQIQSEALDSGHRPL